MDPTTSSAIPVKDNVHREHYITGITGKKYEFIWTINRFSAWSARAEDRHCFMKFPSDPAALTRWILVFNPKSAQDDRYCSVFIKLLSPNDPDRQIPIAYKVTLLNSKNTVLTELAKVAPVTVTVKGGAGESCFIKRDSLLVMISPADKLVIRCTIEAQPEIVTRPVKSGKLFLPEAAPSSFSKDLETLIGDDKFGDVMMIVGAETIQAHKCILTARSPVFAAMFEHSMQEAVNNFVIIEDVEPMVFKALLRYIYTDKVTCLDTKAHELYAVADNYVIPALESRCRNRILEKLCPENAADTLKLADLHSDLEMKRYTLAFICGNGAAEITKTAGWKDMARTHPHLVGEAFDALAARIPLAKEE